MGLQPYQINRKPERACVFSRKDHELELALTAFIHFIMIIRIMLGKPDSYLYIVIKMIYIRKAQELTIWHHWT
jgi:hypothetical protein